MEYISNHLLDVLLDHLVIKGNAPANKEPLEGKIDALVDKTLSSSPFTKEELEFIESCDRSSYLLFCRKLQFKFVDLETVIKARDEVTKFLSDTKFENACYEIESLHNQAIEQSKLPSLTLNLFGLNEKNLPSLSNKQQEEKIRIYLGNPQLVLNKLTSPQYSFPVPLMDVEQMSYMEHKPTIILSKIIEDPCICLSPKHRKRLQDLVTEVQGRSATQVIQLIDPSYPTLDIPLLQSYRDRYQFERASNGQKLKMD